MKFRTDFVTNSSSSSFLSCFLSLKNNSSQYIFSDVEDWELYGIPFSPYEDGVSCWGYKIKTLDELLACLYFYGLRDDSLNLDRGTVPIIVSAFSFLASKISFSEMVTEIRKTIYGENKDYDEWLRESWNEDCRISWRESDEVQELLSLDPEDYDKEDLIDIVKTSFRNFFEHDYLFTDVDENVLFDLSHKNISLSDVEELSFSESGTTWGEFLAGKDDDFREKYRSFFPKISKTDPLFEKVKNKWLKLIEEFYKTQVDLIGELEIDNALETGDIDKVWIDEAAYMDRNEEYFFNVKPPEQYNSAKEKLKKAVKWFCKYPDEDSYNDLKKYFETNSSEVIQMLEEEGLYSEEYNIFQRKWLSEEYNVFRILEFKAEQENPKLVNLLVQNDMIPKIFSEYPITELLDKAQEHEHRDYLALLLSTGLELQFDDVAHYIYNDTLETLYPLFDRGLKIYPSAYDDLITYAADHGKPEYTAWLLNQKNEAAQNDNTKA